MKTWKWVARFLFVCGLLISLGVDWDFVDQGAVTDWQRRVSATFYYSSAIVAEGVAEILKTIGANKKEQK